MVELARARPRAQQKFFLADVDQGTLLVIGEEAVDVLERDVAALTRAGLVEDRVRDFLTGASDLYITQDGHEYYAQMRSRGGEASDRVEAEVRKLLDDHQFRTMFPGAFVRWSEAERLLWSEDSDRDLSTIGHKAREAVQELVSALVERVELADVEKDVAKVKNRLRAVIEVRRQSIGKTRFDVLLAFFEYWSKVVDLVQRQEHSGLREGEDVTWDDARRVVLHTAVLLTDVAQAMDD